MHLGCPEVKVGERVRHVGWSEDHPYGELTELLPDGRCVVVYPNGSTYSWIPLAALESVEVALELKRKRLVKQRVVEFLESGDFAAAKSEYDAECADWWPLAEFEAHRATCVHAAQVAALLDSQHTGASE